MADASRLSHIAGLLLALTLACAPVDGAAAAPNDVVVDENGDALALPSDIVRSIQKMLTKMGYDAGPVDGRMNDRLRAAIESYQRATGRPVDGKATKELAEHMMTQDRVGVMLQRLENAREENIAAAREALLSSEQTRHLLNRQAKREPADPARDPSACFAEPTERCLLREAVESAKAIFKPELRDWAYGEILVSQAKAGLINEAIATVRRIGDARLIIVALRDISRALAQEGRVTEAREMADMIPDRAKRLEALTTVAGLLLAKGSRPAARETAELILRNSRTLQQMLRRIEFDARSAVVVAKAGDDRRALSVLGELEKLAADTKRFADPAERVVAIRHLAEAYADMNLPARALALLDLLPGEDDRMSVLMSVANAQATAGRTADALATAGRIANERYKAVALGRIAAALARAGEEEKCFALAAYALRLTKGIELPYARSYAAGQIALSLAEVGLTYGEQGFSRALEASRSIDNDQLRAYTLWTIANAQARMALDAEAQATAALARQASERIVSSFDRVWMLADVAAERIASGESERARDALGRGLTIARGISDPWGRARALARLAATFHDAR